MAARVQKPEDVSWDRPVMIQPWVKQERRLLIERGNYNNLQGVWLTVLNNDGEGSLGVFLQPRDLPRLILALVGQLQDQELLAPVLQGVHACYSDEARRHADYFIERDLQIDRERQR